MQKTVVLDGQEIDITPYSKSFQKILLQREAEERDLALANHRKPSSELDTIWRRINGGAHSYHGASDRYQERMRLVRGV
jgi:hypothetical protein